MWNGNVPLHEWTSGQRYEDKGWKPYEEDFKTWIFEENSFVPLALLQDGHTYSIMTDHLGTPTEMYDENGEEVWYRRLDMNGKIIKEECHRRTSYYKNVTVPFLFQGQYYDYETELAYNRFRYYSPTMGCYISQDPIGLAGDNPTLYGYVHDTIWWIDVFGLLPESLLQTANPKDINFCQRTINKSFDTPRGKVDIQSEINRIKKIKKEYLSRGENYSPDYPPIKVANIKGQLVVIDGNSRLLIAKSAKLSSIDIEIITDINILREFSARLIRNNIGSQGTKKYPTCKG